MEEDEILGETVQLYLQLFQKNMETGERGLTGCSERKHQVKFMSSPDRADYADSMILARR